MPVPDAEMSTPCLMTRIRERILTAHRQALPTLARLARRMEPRHANQKAAANRIAAKLLGFRLSLNACMYWRKFHAGCGKLTEDLGEDRTLEDKLHFPRFDMAGRLTRQETAPQ